MTHNNQYAVFGNPIAHSRSPEIHQQFAEQTQQDLSYRKQLVARDGFAKAVHEFFAAGGAGLNITLPFKEEAWDLVTTRSARAERAMAVNTISLDWNGQLYGDNTDGAGLVHDLTHNLGVTLKDQRMLLLGAGGAARGVILPLLETHPAALTVVNRTSQRAHDLCADFADIAKKYAPLDGGGFGMLAGYSFDVIINATSASLSGVIPPLGSDSLNPNAVCYDMVYADKPTAFMQWATETGAQMVSDGLGMLVEQAAESFALWRDVRPNTTPILQNLRNELAV